MRHLLRPLLLGTCCRCTAPQPLRVTAASRSRTQDHVTQRWSADRRHLSSASTGTEIIFKSSKPDADLPDVSLTNYMFSKFSKFGDRTALVDDATGTTYRYSELETLARRVGSYLVREGYQQGDVLCYYGTNNPEFALLALGCAAIGVVVSTANPAYTSEELTRHIQHSGSRSIVTVPALVPTVKKTGVIDITVIGHSDGCRPFVRLLEDDGKAFPADVNINPREDVLFLPYSSGTTGLPKGVMLTHHNIVSNLIQMKNSLDTTEEDNNLAVLPFYHIYGLAPIMLGTLQDGATLVTVSGFDPEGFLKAIQNRKITQLHLVPPIILFMARHPAVDKFDLSSIRRTVSAAAPLGLALTTEYAERTKLPLQQGYGLTETSPVVTLDERPYTEGSIGAMLCNTELKIVDSETGQSLDRHQEGEICVRGPQNMKGYLNNEKATKDMIDKDGWLHTGDVGHMLDNNCVVITDRLKELIKYKGLQVAPAELEDLLHKHPNVQDVAVIGVPDDRAGEVPRAFIVSKPGTTCLSDDIVAYVEDNVSDHKRLRGGVEFIDAIPKSPSGKILRRMLKDKAK